MAIGYKLQHAAAAAAFSLSTINLYRTSIDGAALYFQIFQIFPFLIFF
jgi:hypothetical protein